MGLYDKLSQRSVESPLTTKEQKSPLPSYGDKINKPAPKSLTTASISQKFSALPARGAMGSHPDWAHEKRRFISDMPEKEHMEHIGNIVAGNDSPSDIINNFVRGLHAQGKSPQEIRQAFIDHQKKSDNPLVII